MERAQVRALPGLDIGIGYGFSTSEFCILWEVGGRGQGPSTLNPKPQKP